MNKQVGLAGLIAATLLGGCTTTQVWRLDREYSADPTFPQTVAMEQKITAALAIISPESHRHVLTGSRLMIQIAAGSERRANALVPLSLCYIPSQCERVYPASPGASQIEQ